MRALRLLSASAVVLSATLGLLPLLGGCSGDSAPDDARIDADVKEQALLQDGIQQGLSKKPATKAR